MREKPSAMDGTPTETWRFIETAGGRPRGGRGPYNGGGFVYDERFTSVMATALMLERSANGRMARRDKAWV